MKTLRQEMLQLLMESSMDVRDLSQALGIQEKEVVQHLPHITRSAAAKGLKFEMEPAYCENCDFRFDHRQRFTRPGKCPRCRQSRIHGPWYQVIA